MMVNLIMLFSLTSSQQVWNKSVFVPPVRSLFSFLTEAPKFGLDCEGTGNAFGISFDCTLDEEVTSLQCFVDGQAITDCKLTPALSLWWLSLKYTSIHYHWGKIWSVAVYLHYVDLSFVICITILWQSVIFLCTVHIRQIYSPGVNTLCDVQVLFLSPCHMLTMVLVCMLWPSHLKQLQEVKNLKLSTITLVSTELSLHI